ncbi:hypothetical protein HHI36_008856 [Cryptolaemus montrouzieri]|uniref:Uncharacterized protein n=1 Tax=Cryptolaemus montrouzieri TaxID=559131 RepID=A0ABD2MU61_9CUCU
MSWDVLPTAVDVEGNWLKFSNEITKLVDSHRRNIPTIRYPLIPWITSEIEKQIKRKKNLWQKYLRYRSDIDYNDHRRLSNELRMKIRNGKNTYESDIVNSKNPKKIFKYVRSHLSSKVQNPQIRITDGVISNDDDKIANNVFHESYTDEPNIQPPQVDLCPRTMYSIHDKIP